MIGKLIKQVVGNDIFNTMNYIFNYTLYTIIIVVIDNEHSYDGQYDGNFIYKINKEYCCMVYKFSVHSICSELIISYIFLLSRSQSKASY